MTAWLWMLLWEPTSRKVTPCKARTGTPCKARKVTPYLDGPVPPTDNAGHNQEPSLARSQGADFVAYRARVIDSELAASLQSIGAVVIEGPKACGKTETARQAARSEVRLDVDQTAR
jgi:hypothetical protein